MLFLDVKQHFSCEKIAELDFLWFTLVCQFRLPGSVDTFYGRVGFLLVDGGLMIIKG